MDPAKSLTLLAALLTAALLHAQKTPAQFTDPANLRGERVKPRDGRELPIDQGARGLQQMLRKLNTRASLMLIVAHPDDEDGGMLTYYSRGLGARVAVLTLTRGEGGQNAMTGDFEDALGLLRTQELLSADRYLGVDQFFGTEVDFGFSKTKEEAFKKWTHERVLYDAVRSIRLYRPLVIAAVFIGGVTDGHGQHQVSGQIAQEAFKAAADPTVFPDMIAEGILPWQALKVYARVPMQSISDKGLFDYATGKYAAPRFENYVSGEVTTSTPSADVIVHEGTVDPILSDNPSDPPRTYVQFARIGLGLQKSQVGPGVRVPPAGAFDVSYHLYGSVLCGATGTADTQKGCHPERSEGSATPPVTGHPLEPSNHKPDTANFFDGIDTSIAGIISLAPHLPMSMKAGLHDLDSSISRASAVFEATHSPQSQDNELGRQLIADSLTIPIKSIDALISGIERTRLPLDEKANTLHELRIKRVQLNEALLLALGVSLDSEITGGENADVTGKQKLAVHAFLGTGTGGKVQFLDEELTTSPHEPGENIIPSLPPNNPIESELLLDPKVAGKSSRPYFRRTDIENPYYSLDDSALRNAPTTPAALVAWAHLNYSGVPLQICRVVHKGAQPVMFAPEGSLSLSTHAQVLPKDAATALVSTFLYPIEHPAIEPKLAVPTGWKTHIAISDVTAPGEMGIIVDVPLSSRKAETLNARATLHDGSEISEGYRPVGYGDLPRTNYYTPATVRIVPVDLNLPKTTRIAYLPGTGDAVPEALASISLKPDLLTVADLTPAKLAQYDTVILGVRTYSAHHDLHGAPTQALLDYARNGGNVVVQYQTYEFTAADAPYPLSLGLNERVVDETDPVQLLEPAAPLLTTPNKITPADFNNWIEERGHGFLSDWDSHYTALTETHDPDQDPQRGGLITANIGKGRWTYCAFALYRQLPEAVPGAFRLFVNLLAPAQPSATR